jgi:hypothetical protein
MNRPPLIHSPRGEEPQTPPREIDWYLVVLVGGLLGASAGGVFVIVTWLGDLVLSRLV